MSADLDRLPLHGADFYSENYKVTPTCQCGWEIAPVLTYDEAADAYAEHRIAADREARPWSADLDRLLAEIDAVPTERVLVFSVDSDTIRRIAADYAQVSAERDRWRAIADRLGDALDDSIFSDERRATLALSEWRAAKETT